MPVSLRGGHRNVALSIATATLAELSRVASNLAGMRPEIRTIVQSPVLASPTRASSVIIGGALADLVAVIVFVAVGRNSHDESLSASGLLETGWPFAIGVVVGYVGIVLTRTPLLRLRGGAVVAGLTA